MHINTSNLWQSDLMKQAIKDSIPKLDPRTLWRNPVMFAVEMGAILTTMITARDIIAGGNFGSQYCLPTLPRPWQKVAVEPRQRIYVRPAARL
jgi:high-affinity K+ transport system ATPase subunit B